MSIIVGEIVQIALVFTQQGQKWSNVLHWVPDSNLSDTEEIANLSDLVNQLADEFGTAQHDSVQALGGVVTIPLNPNFGARTINLTAVFGDLSGDASQTTQYVTIRKYSNTAIPTERGRILHAGFPEQWSEENVLTQNAVVLLGPLVDAMKAHHFTADAEWVPHIYSQKLETSATLFKANVNPIVKSFHGRQASLI